MKKILNYQQKISLSSLTRVLKSQHNCKYQYSTHQTKNTFRSIFITRPFISASQMLIPFLYMSKCLLNIKVNPINQRPLMNHQLIQVPIHSRQLIDWLYQFLYTDIPLIIFVHLFLSYEHLKIIITAHSFPILSIELNCIVYGTFLVRLQSLKILFLLIPQITTGLSNLLGQRHLHIAVVFILWKSYIFITSYSCLSCLESGSSFSLLLKCATIFG